VSWKAKILNDKVEAELNIFPADMRARFTRIVELIETFGLQNVGMPHVRHLRETLWEMRLKGRGESEERSMYRLRGSV